MNFLKCIALAIGCISLLLMWYSYFFL